MCVVNVAYVCSSQLSEREEVEVMREEVCVREGGVCVMCVRGRGGGCEGGSVCEGRCL